MFGLASHLFFEGFYDGFIGDVFVSLWVGFFTTEYTEFHRVFMIFFIYVVPRLVIHTLSIVIQTTEGRKDLVCIHLCVLEILRFALNDRRRRNSV